jgi:hypothetical protein
MASMICFSVLCVMVSLMYSSETFDYRQGIVPIHLHSAIDYPGWGRSAQDEPLLVPLPLDSYNEGIRPDEPVETRFLPVFVGSGWRKNKH